MNKRKEIKTILACFMIMSILGMGFTGLKVQQVNASSKAVYMNNVSTEEDIDIENNIDIEDEVNEILEGEKNFIEVLESKIDIKIKAYTLIVKNERIGSFQTPGEIDEILKTIKAPFSKSEDENTKITNVKILDKLEVVEEEVYLEDIKKKEEVLDYIRPLITVITTEEVEWIKDIDYETEIKEDPNMYDTKETLEAKGVPGENKIITQQIKHNGKIIEKQVISEEVMKSPTNRVIVKGTKETPKTAPTGSFVMPTRGRLSSSFGERWGRMHRGIDIAKENGSDIKAADGGVVSFSGVMGTYGNMIEIDHENGYKTRYAHCSKLLFSPGEGVYQGQVIAKVGSTGRSTGPHVHFEVIKNGVHQNPSNYLE
ncbi:peptidoglycan DD-metalloendopeptidase family protein [Tissierella creatinophila]|uniref:Murein DD-endopeptidase MepM n=1 Tax=Tissierella creatinophila DSM 6911 TaxID=1123403 RepID=A0A1U7M2H2_TISCR|nr:peptidoglycan DD-metalloendopeptidase family protein [Tissierella creatinophila]OLS01450.1 murein DD-endopeptidase MepM [Tissierella creatinophila DSM 6911]